MSNTDGFFFKGIHTYYLSLLSLEINRAQRYKKLEVVHSFLCKIVYNPVKLVFFLTFCSEQFARYCLCSLYQIGRGELYLEAAYAGTDIYIRKVECRVVDVCREVFLHSDG